MWARLNCLNIGLMKDHRNAAMKPKQLPYALFMPLVSALLVITQTGCGDTRQPGVLLTHLDPRLADGRSSSAVLSSSRRVVDSLQLKAKSAGDLLWRIENARSLPTPEKNGVMLMREHAEKGPVRIVYQKPVSAGEVNCVEMDVVQPTGSVAAFQWSSGTGVHKVFKNVAGSWDVQTVRFYMAAEAGWSGELDGLQLHPACDSRNVTKGFIIHALRLVKVGFCAGFEPLGEGSGDGGLIEINLVAKRAWPADFGVPLHAGCFVNSGARFLAWVAALPCDRSGCARFVLDVRAQGGSWERAAARTVVPEDGWQAIRADLSQYSGSRVEFRMAGLGRAGKIDASKAPEETRCLFGEPLVLGCVDEPARKDVLLITMDTTRADFASDGNAAPCIAALGKDGIVFSSAWSNCNSTLPSHASILTGRYVGEHGAVDNRTFLSPENITLAERFRQAGYHTAAAVSVPHIQAGIGFGQGFDRFLQANEASSLDGKNTVSVVREWIDEWSRDGRRPFFLWVHLFDPHIPYSPPNEAIEEYSEKQGFKAPPREGDPRTVPVFDMDSNPNRRWLAGITNHEHVKHLYGAGVYYCDRLVGQLLDSMKQNGLLDNTVVALAADHGESLGEHGVWYNHVGIFHQQLRVPLVLRVPAGPRGLDISTPVSTLDIAPTIAAVCGLDPVPGVRGVNLLDVAGGAVGKNRRLWFEHAELKQVATRDDRHFFILTVDDGFKLGLEVGIGDDGSPWERQLPIPKGTMFLYDIVRDPDMEHNLAAKSPEAAQRYAALVKEWYEALDKGDVMRHQLSEESEKRLRALGY